jgi:hypothetical protein
MDTLTWSDIFAMIVGGTAIVIVVYGIWSVTQHHE